MDTKQSSLMSRLFGAGGHFAQQKSRRHPSMKPFVVGSAARVELFDLSKTETQLEKAKEVVRALARDGKTILCIGGKQEIAEIVNSFGTRLSLPYVATRWLGGTISNFTEIKKRIDRLAELLSDRDSGTREKKYTKLERLYLDREIERLTLRLDGITTLSKIPDACIVVDTKREAHAVREARAAGIPIIGIMSSDCDLQDATYPIVVNDASRQAVTLVLEELANAYLEGKKGE